MQYMDSQAVLSNRSDVLACACAFRLCMTLPEGLGETGTSVETSEAALGLEISQCAHTGADLT